MPLPLLVAFLIGIAPAKSPNATAISQTSGAPQPFSSPFQIAEPNRIALTPRIDGVIDDEEWDPLSSSPDMKSFFQWEPGKFHFAGIVPAGHDLVASFDIKANGWLIGKDNLEVRVSNAKGKVTIVARLLDATGIAGPTWVDLPGLTLSSRAAAITQGPKTTYEVTVNDLGLGIIPTMVGTKMLMRMDDPMSSDPPAPAYLPRALSPVELVYQRSAALPNGLHFNAEGVARSSVPGEGIKVRLTFNGNNSMKLQRIEMHSEGYTKNYTNQATVPFPKFDEKGRAFVDYQTDIAEGSTEGYRVLKATLMTSDNINAVMECSYRVGPVVDFSIPLQLIKVSPLDRSVRFAYYAKSNSGKRAVGELTITVPDPLKVLNGADHKISIGTGRGSDRQTFEIFFPPNISGTFPVKFLAMINGKKIEQVQFITVGGT